MSNYSIDWDRFPFEGGLADTGRVGPAVVELVRCPASGKFFGRVYHGELHAKVGGTFGLPKAQARREVVRAARKLLNSTTD